MADKVTQQDAQTRAAHAALSRAITHIDKQDDRGSRDAVQLMVEARKAVLR